MSSFDYPKFLSRIIDQSYVTVWDVAGARWVRLNKTDALDGLRAGNFILDDPAGTKPDAALLESSFRDKQTAKRIAAAYGV